MCSRADTPRGTHRALFVEPPQVAENRTKERIMAVKYGNKASEKVERAMHEMKRGELKSGNSDKTVKSPKQAIAIGLSEARRAGGKVPSKRSPSSRSSK